MATTVCLQQSHFSLEFTFKPRELVYVHPLIKCRSSRLSDHSLLMCTELLGSETGSDDMVAGEDTLFSTSSECPTKEKSRKDWKGRNSFPPPLRSISGSDCIKIKSQREGGRLLMEAVNRSCLRTERSHGRFRLFSSTPKIDTQRDQSEHENKVGQKVESKNNALKKGETELGMEEDDGWYKEEYNVNMPTRCKQVEVCMTRFFNFGPHFRTEQLIPG